MSYRIYYADEYDEADKLIRQRVSAKEAVKERDTPASAALFRSHHFVAVVGKASFPVFPSISGSYKIFKRFPAKIDYTVEAKRCNEGVAHYITKIAICNAINTLAEYQQPLILNFYLHHEKTEIKLWPDKAVYEDITPFSSEDGMPYRVDVAFTFTKSEPEYLYEKYGGCCVIEVTDTHKTPPEKLNHFIKNDIAVFEFQLKKDRWGLNKSLSNAECSGKETMMEEKFSSGGILLNMLVNAESSEYKKKQFELEQDKKREDIKQRELALEAEKQSYHEKNEILSTMIDKANMYDQTHQSLVQLENKTRLLETTIQEAQNKIDLLSKENQEKNQIIHSFETSSLLKRLMSAFRGNIS